MRQVWIEDCPSSRYFQVDDLLPGALERAVVDELGGVQYIATMRERAERLDAFIGNIVSAALNARALVREYKPYSEADWELLLSVAPVSGEREASTCASRSHSEIYPMDNGWKLLRTHDPCTDDVCREAEVCRRFLFLCGFRVAEGRGQPGTPTRIEDLEKPDEARIVWT